MSEIGTHGGGQSDEQEQAEPDKSEVQWLISYSDFMMQLVILFVLLFAVSQVDTEKLKQISEAYREYKGLESIIKIKGTDSPHGSIPTDPRTNVILQKLFAGLETKVSTINEGTVWTVGGEFHPFDEGEWVLLEKHKKILDKGIEFLKGRVNVIYIRGFTQKSFSDSVIKIEENGVIKYRKYRKEDEKNPDLEKIADNWQLGMLRAMEVYKYFISKEISSKNLIPMSMGFHNITSGSDPKVNRRVEILISSQKVKE